MWPKGSRGAAGRAAVTAVGLLLAGGAQAQTAPPFLIVNQEQLLTEFQSGKALLAEEESQRDTLRNEARALDASFEEEERKLTEQRPTLDPAEFRRLSDAFDARVVQARREQDARSANLAQELDQSRRQFYARIAPILVQVMDRYGAQAVLDANSVLLADQALNITNAVIAEIDRPAGETAAPAMGTAPDGTPAPFVPPVAPPAGGKAIAPIDGSGAPARALTGTTIDRPYPREKPEEETDGAGH